MSRICLVRPLLTPSDFNGYPLNLLILASCLQISGHEVHICDYDFLKELDSSWINGGFAQRAAQDILSRAPDYVGITAMCSNYVLALDLALELKRATSNVHITFGGPHVSLCAEETLSRYPCVDTAVIGEGEITYPQLIETINQAGDLSQVNGIAYRDEDQIFVTAPRSLLEDLNSSPRPAYELIDMERYLAAAVRNDLEVYAGSGCPFTCTFCSTSIVWERKYRTMSPERIVSEMEFLHSTYGASQFNLIHDNLTVNKDFVHEIAQRIRARGMKIHWGFSSRTDTIDTDIIRDVTEVGCDYVFFGLESGSSKIQRTMGKRLKLDRTEKVIEDCIRHGISPTTSFILGFPDETIEDIAATVRLAFKCGVQGARRSFINLLSAYTGTPVMIEQYQTMFFERESANSTMVLFLEEKHFELIENDRYVFSNYYSLDYKNSPLNAVQFLDLVDFYTICLFKYRYTISFLVNDLQVDPVRIFLDFHSNIRALSDLQRSNLGLQLKFNDLRRYVGKAELESLNAILSFDNALWLIASSKSESMIFSGPVKIGRGDNPYWVTPDSKAHHYILRAVNKEVRTNEIDPSLSELYELQGMPTYRCTKSTYET